MCHMCARDGYEDDVLMMVMMQVVFIGHGGKKKGLKYVDMLGMEGHVQLYTDPKRVTHHALDLTDLSTPPSQMNACP